MNQSQTSFSGAQEKDKGLTTSEKFNIETINSKVSLNENTHSADLAGAGNFRNDSAVSADVSFPKGFNASSVYSQSPVINHTSQSPMRTDKVNFEAIASRTDAILKSVEVALTRSEGISAKIKQSSLSSSQLNGPSPSKFDNVPLMNSGEFSRRLEEPSGSQRAVLSLSNHMVKDQATHDSLLGLKMPSTLGDSPHGNSFEPYNLSSSAFKTQGNYPTETTPTKTFDTLVANEKHHLQSSLQGGLIGQEVIGGDANTVKDVEEKLRSSENQSPASVSLTKTASVQSQSASKPPISPFKPAMTISTSQADLGATSEASSVKSAKNLTNFGYEFVRKSPKLEKEHNSSYKDPNTSSKDYTISSIPLYSQKDPSNFQLYSQKDALTAPFSLPKETPIVPPYGQKDPAFASSYSHKETFTIPSYGQKSSLGLSSQGQQDLLYADRYSSSLSNSSNLYTQNTNLLTDKYPTTIPAASTSYTYGQGSILVNETNRNITSNPVNITTYQYNDKYVPLKENHLSIATTSMPGYIYGEGPSLLSERVRTLKDPDSDAQNISHRVCNVIDDMINKYLTSSRSAGVTTSPGKAAYTTPTQIGKEQTASQYTSQEGNLYNPAIRASQFTPGTSQNIYEGYTSSLLNKPERVSPNINLENQAYHPSEFLSKATQETSNTNYTKYGGYTNLYEKYSPGKANIETQHEPSSNFSIKSTQNISNAPVQPSSQQEFSSISSIKPSQDQLLSTPKKPEKATVGPLSNTHQESLNRLDTEYTQEPIATTEEAKQASQATIQDDEEAQPPQIIEISKEEKIVVPEVHNGYPLNLSNKPTDVMNVPFSTRDGYANNYISKNLRNSSLHTDNADTSDHGIYDYSNSSYARENRSPDRAEDESIEKMEKTPEKVVKVPESPSQTKDEDKPSLASLHHKDLQINVIGPDNLNLDIHKKKDDEHKPENSHGEYELGANDTPTSHQEMSSDKKMKKLTLKTKTSEDGHGDKRDMSGLLIVKKNFQAGDLLSDADSPHITGEKDTTLIMTKNSLDNQDNPSFFDFEHESAKLPEYTPSLKQEALSSRRAVKTSSNPKVRKTINTKLWILPDSIDQIADNMSKNPKYQSELQQRTHKVPIITSCFEKFRNLKLEPSSSIQSEQR